MFFKKLNDSTCISSNAAINIGTNTLRLLIGCVKDDKIIRILTDRVVIRLGKNIEKTALISAENCEKSIKYLLKFKEICNKYGVNKVFTVGTSVLRDAKNSEEFIKTVKEKVGFDIKVISGDEEAELTLKGVLSGLSITPKYPIFIVDVGGGSTEWIYYNKSVLNKGSINIGSLRLFEKFVKSDPPSEFELNRLIEYIKKEISKEITFGGQIETCIVTGGTATSVASIDMQLEQYKGDVVHSHSISLESLKKIYTNIIKIPQSERLKIKGLEIERSDIIISGIAILISIMERINCDSFLISDYGILEGMLKSL